MLSRPEFRTEIRPVFIVGAPRSGTSIMTWALGQHPNLQAMEESNWIAGMSVAAWLAHGLGSLRGEHTHLSSSSYPAEPFLRRLGEFADQVVQDCFRERCLQFYGQPCEGEPMRLLSDPDSLLSLLRDPDEPKRRWVDGTPLNSHYIWALVQMFPQARFIHNLRRPTDVATSLEGFGHLGAEALSLADGLVSWRQHVEAAALAERALGATQVFRLRFERIAEDPENLMRDLFGFLGEEYCPESVAALGERMNSSDTAGKRGPNAEAMLDMPEYLQASSLYWQLQDQRPGEGRDARALEGLRQRFLDACEGRSLL